MKNSKRISKISIIIIVILIIWIVIAIVLALPKQRKASSNKKVNEISSPEDFKNIEEAINYTGSEFVSQNAKNIKIKLRYLPYTDDLSNQTYYLNLIKYVADARDYKSFNIIDEEKNINISVTCDSKNNLIEDYKINNISNYFGKNDSRIEIKNYSKTSEISLNIQSDVIKNTINSNWIYDNINYGSMESSLDDYRIYFEEGYDIRVIENDDIPTKVFNIVFNSRYKGNIVNNLNTSSTFEEIKNVLGEPAFDDGNNLLIGYKSKDIYVFFVRKNKGIEISIYNVEQYNTEQFSRYVEDFCNNLKYNNLVDNIFSNWKDPNIYETSSNNDYVRLKYTGKGISIEFNTGNPSGITIYKNFKGKITDDITFEEIINGDKELPEYIYFKNEDSIFLEEQERKSRYSVDDNYPDNNELFYVVPSYISDGNVKILTFFSKDGKNPDFQIYENIYKTLWADNTHFIYSIKNQGIYMIDVLTRKKTTLVNGTWEYNLKKIENGVLSYDDTSIKVNF